LKGAGRGRTPAGFLEDEGWTCKHVAVAAYVEFGKCLSVPRSGPWISMKALPIFYFIFFPRGITTYFILMFVVVVFFPWGITT
jgi:hypothetical protein